MQNDESRMYNLSNNWRTGNEFNGNLISFSVAYLEDTIFVKKYFKITDRSQVFTTLTPVRKNGYVGEYAKKQHKSLPIKRGYDDLYSQNNRPFTPFVKDSSLEIKRFTGRIQRLFVPKFFHEINNTNFLKFVGERSKICWRKKSN